MMSNWEIATGVFVDASRRDEVNTSNPDSSNDTGDHTWYISDAAGNTCTDIHWEAEKASGETNADVIGDGVCGNQGASNEIWYFPSDDVEHFHEIDVDSQDTNETGLVQTEEQADESETGTEEDTIAALDNLAVLLGEPPRKKSVWDHFDLIVKNKPMAEYMEESEIMRSGVRNEPSFQVPISRPNSKRKSQKKSRCDFSNEDAPKMVRTMSKSKNLTKKHDLGSEFEQKEQASSMNCFPNNNVGNKIALSDTSGCISAQANNNAGNNFKDKLIQLPSGVRLMVVKPPPKVPQSFSVIQQTPRFPSMVASTESIGSNYEIMELPSSSRTRNVSCEEVPPVVINFCDHCDFQSSQLQLLQNHMRYCCPQNNYQK